MSEVTPALGSRADTRTKSLMSPSTTSLAPTRSRMETVSVVE
jgi:hypothetical protein